MNLSLQIRKKCTSPAKEFRLHKCRNKTLKINFSTFKSEKIHKSHVETIGIRKKKLFFSFQNRKKNSQVQLMSFHYINIEIFLSNLKKKCTSPAKEFS